VYSDSFVSNCLLNIIVKNLENRLIFVEIGAIFGPFFIFQLNHFYKIVSSNYSSGVIGMEEIELTFPNRANTRF